MVNHGYLFDNGFVRSKIEGEVVFKDGSPAPWLSYPFLEFFIPRLKSSISLFEYGLGNSSLFFMDKLGDHYGVEHDIVWYEKLQESIDTEKLKLVKKKDFSDSISNFGRKFQVIIIDGILRNECLNKCTEFLEPDGIIILDDAEREEYAHEIKNLKLKGFKSLEFYGMKAFGRHSSSTNIYYRSNNWLNI